MTNTAIWNATASVGQLGLIPGIRWGNGVQQQLTIRQQQMGAGIASTAVSASCRHFQSEAAQYGALKAWNNQIHNNKPRISACGHTPVLALYGGPVATAGCHSENFEHAATQYCFSQMKNVPVMEQCPADTTGKSPPAGNCPKMITLTTSDNSGTTETKKCQMHGSQEQRKHANADGCSDDDPKNPCQLLKIKYSIAILPVKIFR